MPSPMCSPTTRVDVVHYDIQIFGQVCGEGAHHLHANALNAAPKATINIMVTPSH